MADELVLYTHPLSRGRIARWMLEETGQAYRAETLDFGTTMKSAAFLELNPMGKVPAIRHGDTVVTETAAICAYLADAFPAAGLAPPPGDRLRGSYYRWLFFAAGPLEAAVTNKAFGLEPPEARKVSIGYGSYADVMNALERAVTGRRHIVGEAFSAADLYVGAQLGSGMRFGIIEKRPAFERYWEGLAARPAAVRARQTDDALAAEMKKASASG